MLLALMTDRNLAETSAWHFEVYSGRSLGLFRGALAVWTAKFFAAAATLPLAAAARRAAAPITAMLLSALGPAGERAVEHVSTASR